ncbi:MAG: hypothetical protein FJY80_10500, partial [Candidatus Aminicenantes bacterium]|nr:hypothetical protein [Candidatus Aminicenantes bacterium]
MTIWKCYGRGFKAAASRPTAVVLLWLFNLALALGVSQALAAPLAAHFGPSLALDKLMASFDLNVFLEFLAGRGEVVDNIIGLILIAVAVNALAWPFFQGGVLNSLLQANGRTKREAAVFFEGGGRFYGRFFRLEVLSVLLWVPSAMLLVAASSVLDLAAADPDAESLRFILFFVKLGLALLLYNLVRMVLDYARVKVALTDTRRVFDALLAAARFVLGKFGRAFALFYLFALTALPFLLGYAALRGFYPQTTAAKVAAVFFLGQVSILVRGVVRVAFQAGQMEFFRSFEPAKRPGGEGDHGLEKVEHGVHGDSHELEGEENKP